jgi:hypothetical protein
MHIKSWKLKVIKIIDYDLEVKVKVIKIIDYDLEVKGK